MSFGKETVFKVEARSMLEGLLIAWDKGYYKIEVECDNELLIQILLSGEGSHSDISELCLLHLLLQRKWEVRLQSIRREQNVVAEHMAKYTSSKGSLSSISALLEKDRNDSRSF